jgi:actin-like ATPase involved in cell morphogenesis
MVTPVVRLEMNSAVDSAQHQVIIRDAMLATLRGGGLTYGQALPRLVAGGVERAVILVGGIADTRRLSSELGQEQETSGESAAARWPQYASAYGTNLESVGITGVIAKVGLEGSGFAGHWGESGSLGAAIVDYGLRNY